MKKISSIEIKNEFLSFFKEKDHMEIKDSSIIPKNDPTLLFINSGMAPIKNYFTGVETPPYMRLCDIQPCIRTIDIDSIGDKHHLTSFQMLGSWSINDYFKEKAIFLAFEFLTERLNIPKEKLYITVFSGDEEMGLPCDEEAYEYWKKAGVSEDHIVKCGKEDNFWGPTAATGPCGPCTEIFFDTGEGEKYIPGGEFDTKKRYIEIWNAGVFMQFNKNEDGTFSKLSFTSVDTGAGLERLSMVLNGHSTVYDTDLLSPIKKFIENKIGDSLKLPEKDILVMTDHLRTSTLILSEKVSPSNEGRGYIPRKLIRRCMMIIAKNKIYGFDFESVIEFIIDNYSNMFVKFRENKDYVIKEFHKEQEQFQKVLEKGLERLEQIRLGTCDISAHEAFDLVTTYGLPFDIIKNYAYENNMFVDEIGFKSELEKHKEKSKNSGKSVGNESIENISKFLLDFSSTEFIGYETLKSDSHIIGIINKGEKSNSGVLGDSIIVILDKSPFYAESGGQCSDSGYIYNEKCKIRVNDVKKSPQGIFMHFGIVESGEVKLDDKAVAEVDEIKRSHIACNHTAVHLLQSALQNIFGKNVHQAGSKVEESKLRFDFNYDGVITEEEIFKIEKAVNSYIRKNLQREVKIQKLSEAISEGAMALFENKYGDMVRVVSYGDISRELCGGTHIEKTGDIGLFVIFSVEGIGKGMKRITAFVGEEALIFIQKKSADINKLAKILKVKPEIAVEKAEKELLKKESKKSEPKIFSENDIVYIDDALCLKTGYIVMGESYKKFSADVTKYAEKIDGILIGIAGNKKKQIVVAVSDSCVQNHPANEILLVIMKKLEGKGGGNKKVATGGTEKSSKDIIKVISEFCCKK